MIPNHTIYICRRIISTVYFIYKSITNKTESTSGDTRTSKRHRPKNKKDSKR